MTDAPEWDRTPCTPMEFKEGKSCLDRSITWALIDENYAANHNPAPYLEQTRQETIGSSEALENSMFLHLIEIKLTSLPLGTSATGQQLVLAAQTEFTITEQPTRCGHTHQTRDMVEVTACICGILWNMSRGTAMRLSSVVVRLCGYINFHSLPTISLSTILSFILNVSILR